MSLHSRYKPPSLEFVLFQAFKMKQASLGAKWALLHFRTSLHPVVITQQTVYHTAALPQAFHMLCDGQCSSLPGGCYRQIKHQLTAKLPENSSKLVFVVS